MLCKGQKRLKSQVGRHPKVFIRPPMTIKSKIHLTRLILLHPLPRQNRCRTNLTATLDQLILMTGLTTTHYPNSGIALRVLRHCASLHHKQVGPQPARHPPHRWPRPSLFAPLDPTPRLPLSSFPPHLALPSTILWRFSTATRVRPVITHRHKAVPTAASLRDCSSKGRVRFYSNA